MFWLGYSSDIYFFDVLYNRKHNNNMLVKFVAFTYVKQANAFGLTNAV